MSHHVTGFRLRALLAILAVFALATGTAVAQDDAPADVPAADDADAGADDEPEAKGDKKKPGNKADDDDEVECEPADGVEGDSDQSGEDDTDGATDEERECVPPPRCADGQVDLAPDEDEANCIDQRQLSGLIADFEAAAAEEAEALEELSAALDGLDLLNGQLDELRRRLGEVQLRLSAARAEVGFAALRQMVATEGLDDVSAALAAEEEQLRQQAVEAYVGGDGAELATGGAIDDLNSYNDLEIAREYARTVIDDQLTTIGQVDALRQAVVALTDVVAGIEAGAEADAERVQEIEDQVDELIVRQQALVAEAELEAEAIAERIGEIQARKQAYAEELRITGAGGGSIGEMLRTQQIDQVAPDNPFATLAMPLLSTRLGSPFGPRVHPIFSDTRLHTGIDMSGNAGDQILSSEAGVVVYAEETSGYGNVVVVDHGNTIATLYAHMTADAVFVGQEVELGELLGFVGSTGFSTGPHLHYEVRINGQPVDPMPYLRLTDS